MLQSIRDRAQGWFAAIIFSFIIVAFALWGINFYVRAEGEVPVAEVDGEEIRLAQFERDYQQYRRQLQAAMGDKVNVNNLDQAVIKNQALQQVIDAKVLEQAGRRMKLRVSDGQVAATIQGFEPFQRDGQFAKDLYDRRLQDLGLSPTGFEDQMRREMTAEQLRQGVADTVFVTAAATDRIERLRGQTRDLAYAVIAAEPFKAAIAPADAEIESYYRAHTDRYSTPETVRIAYLDLAVADLARTVAVSEDDLQRYYEEHKSTYSTPEERSANHILVHVKKDAPAAAVEAARKQAEAYLAEAQSGKSFEDIASAHSDDVGSKGEGGKTGFFRRGVMAREFDEAAFAMQPGEIRGPIRTEFGFHVIRLNEIRPAATKTFAEVRDQVEAAYRQEAGEKLYYEKGDQFSTLTYENSDSLQPAAAALGLTIMEGEPFARGGGKDLTADQRVIDAAFSDEVLKQGLNSQPLEIADGRTVVLRVIDHQPAAPKELAAVRDEIVMTLVAAGAKDKAAARASALLDRLRGGETREALAQAENLVWTEARGVTRDSADVNRAINRAAFKLRSPQAGQPAYGGVPMGTGDYAMIAVLATSDGDPAKADAKARDQTKLDLQREHASADWEDYFGALRTGVEIETHPDRL